MTTIVATRDGRQFLGCLKTYDQFGNVVLDRCVEKLTISNDPVRFAELYLGVIMIRGENVTYFGILEQPSAIKYQQNISQIWNLNNAALGKIDEGTIKVPFNEISGAITQLKTVRKQAKQLWEQYKNIISNAVEDSDIKPLIMSTLNLHTDAEFNQMIRNLKEAQQVLNNSSRAGDD